jgi:CBS domain-containing protein
MTRQTVADVMHRDVPVVPVNASYKELALALAAHHAGALPVVDADGKVAGVVSESDLIERTAGKKEKLRANRWRHARRSGKANARMAVTLMTQPVVHVAPDTEISTAARIALDANVHHLPVLDGDALVGMVDRADLLAGYLRSDDSIREQILQKVVAADFCIDPAVIDVVVRDGIVVLSGCVDHRPLAAFLLQAVREVPGVVDVENRLSWRHDDARADSRRPHRYPS